MTKILYISTVIASSMLLSVEASAFGRDESCQPATGNWVNASPVSCPMLGNGSQRAEAVIKVRPEPSPHECPPKEDDEDQGGGGDGSDEVKS